MAASILRGFGPKNYCNKIPIFSSYTTRNASGGNSYYVLLPEIPPDTPETNPIMRTTELPKFSAITPEKSVTGCAKLSIEYETQLGDILEKIKDPSYKKTFSSVFEPIEKISAPLNFAWRTVKHLSCVKGKSGFREAFQRVHPQVERARNERWISQSLYSAVKEINADSESLDEYQRRLVKMYLIEGKLNGINLFGNDKKRFVDTLKKLSEGRSHFKNKVMICGYQFVHNETDFGKVAEFPRHIISHLARDKNNPSRGPWQMTLQPTVYQSCLEYCNDRITRWNLWNAFNNRAALSHNDQQLANFKAIEEIRTHRRDIAEILGYSNFAEMSMETKMAGNVENVLNMIDRLKTEFRDIAGEEMSKLQTFAKSEGFPHTLAMWDIPYWRRRQQQHLYKADEATIAQYFPFSKVLSGLFKLSENLFNIKIKDCSNDADLWDESVKLYNIHDANGSVIASLYMDPYVRLGEKAEGTWMDCGRESSNLYNTKPISYWTMNLPAPIAGRSPNLTFKDVKLLFHEFGHGLQQMLTQIPYCDLSGQRNVEWDALQVCSTFMEELLTLPDVIKSISGHQDTNEVIPDDLVNDLLKSEAHMTTYDLMRQLYFSALDMEMYISKDHWHDIMTRVWREFMPVELDKDDNHPCSLTHIFSDQYPAAYYSYKWSEMISADAFEALIESGWNDNEKVLAKGQRFRETFLSLGGAVPAGEVFRRYRGRDPSLDALVRKYQKLSKDSSS